MVENVSVMTHKRNSSLSFSLTILLVVIFPGILVGVNSLQGFTCFSNSPYQPFSTPNVSPLFWGNANGPFGRNDEATGDLLSVQDILQPLTTSNSRVVTSGSKLTRREKLPLLADFQSAFLQSCDKFPSLATVFEIGNLNGQTAGSHFLDVFTRDYKNRGVPEDSKLAKYAADVITSTFDEISSRQIPYLFANVFGSFLLDRGLLTAANTESLASAAAVSMVNSAAKVKPTNPEDFVLSNVNGVFAYFESLGYNINDILWDITLYFESELNCLSKGLCE